MTWDGGMSVTRNKLDDSKVSINTYTPPCRRPQSFGIANQYSSPHNQIFTYKCHVHRCCCTTCACVCVCVCACARRTSIIGVDYFGWNLANVSSGALKTQAYVHVCRARADTMHDLLRHCLLTLLFYPFIS